MKSPPFPNRNFAVMNKDAVIIPFFKIEFHRISPVLQIFSVPAGAGSKDFPPAGSFCNVFSSFAGFFLQEMCIY